MRVCVEPVLPPVTLDPKDKDYSYKAEEPRLVRFLLHPQELPSDEAMTTRMSIPRAAKNSQIVLPSAFKEEETKLGSSSRWGRDHLKMLGVDFYAKTKLDLNRVLGVNESEWTPELRGRVFEGGRQLAAVDANALCSGDIDIDDVSNRLAPKFIHTFKSLYNVMVAQETKLRIKQAKQASQFDTTQISTSTDISQNQSPSIPSSTEPRTPDQPTHPSDPKWSGSSTSSQDEEATKKLLYSILSDTMTILESDFQKIQWQRSGLKVEILQTENDHMKFLLGIETITTINDGGLGISYMLERRPVKWQPGGIRPVLSIEAKCQRAARKDDPELRYQYTGQIFCEMLGQTCHKEFYEHIPGEYQEAFILHGSHSSVTIYYAKLPHSYLREITRYGKNYIQHSVGQIIYNSITVATDSEATSAVSSITARDDSMKGIEVGNSEGDISAGEDTDDDVKDDVENLDEEGNLMDLE